MEKYEKTSHFNICEKCGMVLTKEVNLNICRTGTQSMTGKRSTRVPESSSKSSTNTRKRQTT
jgi:hypothetical protein